MKLKIEQRLRFLDRRIAAVTDESIRAELQAERNAIFFETDEGKAQMAADVGRIVDALEIGKEPA